MTFRTGDLVFLPHTGKKTNPKIAIIIAIIPKEDMLYNGKMLWDHYRYLIHVGQKTMYVTEEHLKSFVKERKEL